MYHENLKDVFNNVFIKEQNCNLENILPQSERKLYLREPTSFLKNVLEIVLMTMVQSVIRPTPLL